MIPNTRMIYKVEKHELRYIIVPLLWIRNLRVESADQAATFSARTFSMDKIHCRAPVVRSAVYASKPPIPTGSVHYRSHFSVFLAATVQETKTPRNTNAKEHKKTIKRRCLHGVSGARRKSQPLLFSFFDCFVSEGLSHEATAHGLRVPSSCPVCSRSGAGRRHKSNSRDGGRGFYLHDLMNTLSGLLTFLIKGDWISGVITSAIVLLSSFDSFVSSLFCPLTRRFRPAPLYRYFFSPCRELRFVNIERRRRNCPSKNVKRTIAGKENSLSQALSTVS